VELAVRRFLAFAGDAPLVAHNARFDVAFLNRQLERLTGRRLSAPTLDTVALARRLLAGRVARTGLASLAHFFGTSATPCHRALPDAQATAEILLALIGLAQERGARTVADLAELAATRTRRVHEKRSLAFGAPMRPGVYLFRDRYDQVLYVGRARDLRARLRSYFRSDRQRPAIEAALAALERIGEREYDAIVTDIKMPGMNGLVLLAEILARRPDTPTLMITGHGEYDLALRCLRGGAYDFIQKPIDRESFVASLHRAIQAHAANRRMKERSLALERCARELEKIVLKLGGEPQSTPPSGEP
jgi:DNA polymerase III epsilon subunit-like protein